MEIKNIHEHAGWYASYMSDLQGMALVKCQAKKIKQLTEVIETIKGQIELTKEPRVHNDKIVLDSIEALIDQIGGVEHKEEYFKWVG